MFINSGNRNVILAVALSAMIGCGSRTEEKVDSPKIDSAQERERLAVTPPNVKFRDITDQAGIDFVHVNGAKGRKLLPETMGSGVAFIDFNKDGKQDILFVNSRFWPGDNTSRSHPTMQFYQNVGKGKFANVTKEVDLDVSLFGMGVTVGDYDNDGWDDLFVTAVGGNQLFRNVAGDKSDSRKFKNVTEHSPDLQPQGAWSESNNFAQRKQPLDFPSSAAFFDYDNDGFLDLFVCNYVEWSPGFDLAQGFTLQGRGRAYGPPRAFRGMQCQLFHNNKDGTFRDVSRGARINVTGELGEAIGKSLGVSICDIDNDGYQDIFVANDTVRNFLFLNQQNGTFREIGQDAGIAYADGQARGAMGIDWGEYRPGNHAFVIGNFANEPNTLYRLDDTKRRLFSDVALIEGLAGPSRIMLVFGLFYFDYDLDGNLDILTCNGHLEPDIHLVQSSQSYKQSPQLFWNTGESRRWEPVSEKYVGEDLLTPIVGRGCAYADIDQDGDLDVVLTTNGGPAHLYENLGNSKNNWIRLHLQGDGKKINRNAIGTKIVLKSKGGIQVRHVASARGYLSQSEFPVTFGLGKDDAIERVDIYWPGQINDPQSLTDLNINQDHRVTYTPK